MMRRKHQKVEGEEKIKEEKLRLERIIKVLVENPNGVWIREIARQSKMHPEQVRRMISKYPQIFEEYVNFTHFGINLKIIRLKKGYRQHLALIYASFSNAT